MKNQSITVRIDAEKNERLQKLAESMDRSKSYIIEDAISNYLEVNEWQVSEIKKAVVKANNPNTKWVSHEDIEKKYLK